MSASTSAFLLAICMFLTAGSARAHSGADLAVILDTDMALDDIRALALLSSHEGVTLLACVTSDGACAPEGGAANLRRVLPMLGLEHVPIAAGGELGGEAPPWRPMSEAVGRPSQTDVVPSPPDGSSSWAKPAAELLAEVLRGRVGVVYVCLGPLSNLADLLAQDPSAAEQIAAVHYWGSTPDVSPPSWNTARDIQAARAVFSAGLPVRAMHLADEQLLCYDSDLAQDICVLKGPAADLLCRLHESGRPSELVAIGHLRCWDESIVLDLLFPDLFTWRPGMGGVLELGCDLMRIRQRYLDLLSGDLSMKPGHRHAVCLRSLPTMGELLRPDVAAISDETLARFGRAEWNAVLLTNELHRHLGIYSILGAKMGIRARELLQSGMDELSVVSRAGDRPPLSCLTDGLQVSTGATLGRGTIAVAPELSSPQALFRSGDRSVELTIKMEVLARVRRDIETCIAQHGALTPAYWQAVRALALDYWREMDRAEIFDEVWVEGG